MMCKREWLDEAEKAIAHGYNFNEVVVVLGTDGAAYWDWKKSPNPHVFHRAHRPGHWMVMQIRRLSEKKVQFTVDYFECVWEKSHYS